MKHVSVTDERGKAWVVYSVDPAWNHCRFLVRAGVGEIVLPRQTLLLGTVPQADSIDVPEISIDIVRMPVDIQAITWRLVRLRDCVRWLEMSGFGRCERTCV